MKSKNSDLKDYLEQIRVQIDWILQELANLIGTSVDEMIEANEAPCENVTRLKKIIFHARLADSFVDGMEETLDD